MLMHDVALEADIGAQNPAALEAFVAHHPQPACSISLVSCMPDAESNGE